MSEPYMFWVLRRTFGGKPQYYIWNLGEFDYELKGGCLFRNESESTQKIAENIYLDLNKSYPHWKLEFLKFSGSLTALSLHILFLGKE